MTSSKQTKSKSKKTKASLIPLAVGVGVGALSGVALPYQDGQTQIIKAHAEEGTPVLPSQGADFTKDMGDVSNYNLITNSSNVQFYNGKQWVSAIIPFEIKGGIGDLKTYNGKLYASVSDNLSGTILRYDEEGRTWEKVGTTSGPIFDLIVTEDGKFISGGGAVGTYGTDFNIYSSVDNDSSWQTRLTGYKSNSVGSSNYMGIFYTGVDAGSSILMFGASGNWTFINSSTDGKNFSYKQEIYGAYTSAIRGGGKLVATGTQIGTSNTVYGSIATATEGGAFTVQKMGIYERLYNSAYGNGTYVVVGSGNNGIGVIYSSKDGTNWSKSTIPSNVSSKTLYDVTWDEANKRFVAVGASGTMLLSLDGQQWVSVNTGLTTNIVNIELNANKETPYDIALNELVEFNKNLATIDYKTFTLDDKTKKKEELQKIIDEKVEAVPSEAGKKKLKDNLVNESNKKIDGMHFGYLRYNQYLELKKEVEGMPSTTPEEISAQLNKIITFEYTLNVVDIANKASFSKEISEYKKPLYLKEAKLLVEKAETTFLQEDLRNAMNKVDSLFVDATQKELKNRLFTVQNLIPYKQAEKMVVIAEKSLLDADYNNAKKEMSNLNYGPKKSALENRLDWVALNIANNVLKKLQEKPVILYEDYSNLEFLYNRISVGNTEVYPERMKLLAEKQIITLRMYVSGIKNSYNDSSFNSIETLYKLIPTDSPNKAVYKNDYDLAVEMKKYKTETLAIQSWVRWQKSPTDIANGTKALNSLPEGILKDYFKQVLGLGTNYAKEAETLLTQLEQTFSAEKVATIQKSISQVTDAKVKEDLTNRLNQAIEKENVRLAEQAVSKAEETPDYEVVKTANEAIQNVKDETTKTALVNRLDKVVEDLKLAEATVALTKLIENPSEETYSEAMKQIEAVKDETKRTEMKEQADKALETYKVLMATEALKTAQNELTKESYTKAQTAIEGLQESEAKENLSLALQDVLEMIKTKDAKEMILSLKENPNQADLDKVMEFVNELKASDSKTELLDALEMVQDSINLKNAQDVVENVKSNPTQESVTEALKVVTELKNSDAKTELLNALEMVQDSINLKNAQAMVEKVEENPTQESVNEALKVVNELKSSDAKTELVNKLSAIQDAINLKNAKALVEEAKATPTQANVNVALKAVNDLKNSEEKTQLMKTLDEVQESINLENAKKLVVKATEELTQESIDNAKKAIQLVKNPTSKVELEKTLQIVQDVVDAKPVRALLEEFEMKLDAINKRPKSSEAQALTNEYNAIAKKVNALNNGEVKTELVQDLKDVKETLDYVIKNGNHPNKQKLTLRTIIHWVLHLVFGR